MANSGSSLCVSPCGLMAWMSGAHLVAEMGGCNSGASCCSTVPVFGAVMGGCCYLHSFRVAPEAPACEYLCNMRDHHAAAATAAALGGISTFIPVWEDVLESASLVFAWTWLSGIVVLCAGIWNLFGARRDFGKVSSNRKEKIRFAQKRRQRIFGTLRPSGFDPGGF